MSDAADAVDGIDEPIANGAGSVTLEPVGGGTVKLTVEYGGDVVESGEYPTPGVFSKPTPKGMFLNRVEDALEDRSAVDAGDVRQELAEWLAEFNELGREEQAEHVLPAEVTAIIDGTHYPVEVYRGDPTTWKVTLTYAGQTRDLEFTNSEMVSGGAGALEEKIANHFLEFINVEPEDWEEIRDRWTENKEVVHTADETTADAIADRVLEYLADGALPVADRDKIGNDPAAVWFDESNGATYTDADPDAAIAWVQDRYFVDQLESAGKKLEYKGQLIKDLIARGDLYGPRARRRWIDGARGKFYPFDPDALGIDADDVGGDEPAHSEVDA